MAAGRDLAVVPPATTSHYEDNAAPAALYRQGAQAGHSGAQGIVILDFGRPAAEGSTNGTIDYRGTFASLASIAVAVERYVGAYYVHAPAYTTLYVAVGTNDSCGTGQPCGSVVCGCVDEPTSFFAWGGDLAATVERVAAWTARFRHEHGFTDDVRVVAADDVEPAFDPGYQNTDELLQGYAHAVGGSAPAMVDFGSADANYWTEAQLYQVAFGLPPDVPMPEVYYPDEATQWADLVRYARDHHDKPVTIFGVLTGTGGANDPRKGYLDMLRAVSSLGAQRSIRWLSTIAPLRA